jgi:hypothetical protein
MSKGLSFALLTSSSIFSTIGMIAGMAKDNWTSAIFFLLIIGWNCKYIEKILDNE